MHRQTVQIGKAARALGFVRVGFVPAQRFDDAAVRLESWLERGYHGEMAYLAGTDRADPRTVLPAAQTVIVVALPYPPPPAALRRSRDGDPLTEPLRGTVAAYAGGADYHAVLKRKLYALADECSRILERPVLARPAVDTAPLLEREAARRAGVGFTGKSGLALIPGQGTYVLLGELLVDAVLTPTEPIAEGCGQCTACLDACPTNAFVGPYVLDARACISYLTIELRGPIPRHLRRPIGTRVFGCDVCQDVCPYNATAAKKPAAPELSARSGQLEPDLVQLLELGASAYRKLVRGSALRRVSRPRLARNAAVALGNTGDSRAVAPLTRAVARDPSPLVRGHAAWALGELGGAAAEDALAVARRDDPDPDVREEAEAALAALRAR